MELTRSSWGDSANAGVAAGDFVLILDGPDQPGIVHAVSGFLFGRGGNIMESQQFFDRLKRLVLHADRLHSSRHRHD